MVELVGLPSHYIAFCRCTYPPHSSMLEDLYSDPHVFPYHEEHVPTSLFIYRTFPSYIISQEYSFKLSFQDQCYRSVSSLH